MIRSSRWQAVEMEAWYIYRAVLAGHAVTVTYPDEQYAADVQRRVDEWLRSVQN